MKLSIIIPAYNEEKVIGNTLKDYATFYSEKLKDDFEILVILNGCRDKTSDVVKNMIKEYPQIKYKNFSEPIGKGGAVIEGFKIANGSLIGFVDADGATMPDAFHELVENIGDNEGIIASRWIKGARILKKQPLSRRIASRAFNVIVKALFGINVRDSQCGCKLFKDYAIKIITPKLGITQWAFDIDLLYLMKKLGYKIAEIPTTWKEPGYTHLNLKKTIPEMFLAISRLRLIYSPFSFIVNLYDFFFVRKK